MVFASACEYFAARQLDGPACVIADLHLPEMTGLDFQRRIAPTCRPIIFWARHADLASAVHAIKAGAVDVLTPSSTDHDPQCAVQMALDQDAAVRIPPLPCTAYPARSANSVAVALPRPDEHPVMSTVLRIAGSDRLLELQER
jgi:DNA-binding NtrC family response regulator